jgi:hypothetical protein
MIIFVVKTACDALAALFALGAAVAWFKAAEAALPVGSFPDWSDAHAVQAALRSYQSFVRGAVWNKRAAVLAGLSAAAATASWTIATLTAQRC